MLHEYASMPHMNAEHLLTSTSGIQTPPNGGNFGLVGRDREVRADLDVVDVG